MYITICVSLTIYSVAILIMLFQIHKIKSDQRYYGRRITGLERECNLYKKQAECLHENVKFIAPVECDTLGYMVNLSAKMKCLDCEKILKTWNPKDYKEYKKEEARYYNQRAKKIEEGIKTREVKNG